MVAASSAQEVALRRLSTEAEWSRQECCYVTLLKLLGNIVDKPTEAKFRHLSLENAALKNKVFDVPGGVDYLVAVGFKQLPDGKALELPAEAIHAVAEAKLHLKRFADEANMNHLRHERDARIAEERRKAAEKHVFTCHKEIGTTEEEKARIKEELERDRKEFEAERQAMGPTQASKAKDVNFGANDADTSFLRGKPGGG
eukprot:TRINITY_DN6833_c0_g1_i1.p1 TRINITY_DN6833_c0_g1~~TRINITY_DN6833_c0_g1_i1.p1  ORF type:complete len:200 (+),score=68.06 TRINITY_DN6833_c0_g1_i1:54-653(+)